MSQARAWAIGVDVGGTKTIAARVDADGCLDKRIRFRTDVAGGPAAALSGIVNAARELMQDADTPPLAMGVGVAGQIDEEQGMVRFAPNLAWRDIPLGSSLSDALDLPVVLLNDVRAATWGEWLHGAGRGSDDLICVFVGTGIGGGVVSGGRMVGGCSNTAGEIGHMTIEIGGPRCRCRNSGCLEALAGGWAIARNAQDAVRRDPAAGAMLLSLSKGDPAGITAATVGKAMLAGDDLARSLMDDTVQALVAGCVTLVNAFNPCRLILGGGVIEGMPWLVDRIREGVHGSALLAAEDRLQVFLAELREDSGVIGMAAYVLRTMAEGKRGRTAA